MSAITIRDYRTGRPLYQTAFGTLKNATEQAVREGVSLAGADLRHGVLAGANLDDADLRHAVLDEANLTGANLSESNLAFSSLRNATLHGTCLCLSDLTGVEAEGALFGGTDIAGARLIRCRFAGWSALGLGFTQAETVRDCFYTGANGAIARFSGSPLVVGGLASPFALFENHILLGANLFRRPPGAGGSWQILENLPRVG